MNVSITTDMEAWIQQKIASGMYTSASEVIREALRLLHRTEQAQWGQPSAVQYSLPAPVVRRVNEVAARPHEQAIAQEHALFRAQHTQLAAVYAGQFVAMYGGQLVDHDPDFDALFARVRTKFGNAAVMLTQVNAEPDSVITRRGFRIEQAVQ